MIVGDDPVYAEGDRLGRKSLAENWADTIISAKAPFGLVFAVTGPWGSGKTSMLNMMEEKLRASDVTVLKFNPWLFSGTDQLISHFFGEMASQLDYEDPKQKEIAGRLKKYGTLFSPLKAIPVIGSTLGGAADAASTIGKYLEDTQSRGVEEQRRLIEDSLRELDSPLVLVVDDIDRLTGQEIRDVLRMVRLTGAFPNLIYLLSFDRQRVELALNEDGLPGRAYLEKIVQVMYDVPIVVRDSLRNILLDELNHAVQDTGYSRFSAEAWPDVLVEIIDPLLNNIRDVRRYIGPLRAVLTSLENEVELVDVLALEALRIFLPDSYALLPPAARSLTDTADASHESSELKAQAEAFVNSDPNHANILRSLCARIFPASRRRLGEYQRYGGDWERTWLRERRVASNSVLSFYLEKSMPSTVKSAITAEAIFSRFEDRAYLEHAFQNMGPAGAEEVIRALEAYEDQFSNCDPIPSAIVLLNQLPRLQRPKRGLLDPGPTITISRVVLRLLRPIADPEQVLRIAKDILPNLEQYSTKFELTRLVGHAKNAGHKLISETAWKDLETSLKNEVRSASADSLATEWDLLRLLWQTGQGEDSQEWRIPLEFIDHPALARAILTDSVGTTQSQSFDSRAITKKKHLAWDILMEVLGDENAIIRCRDAAASIDETADDLIELVDLYLSGWRPPRW
ncbi:P-loop NTPase fold protein [Microbispora sp. H11081]|uniref:KAP family P-loop NTPase fold protein n=1 Tax=Microbispora sp. H11081 TaxID=2729107 RepID=UPI0014752C40|nr:P-loop NTPase fold protein [Microbispora sp. H11081]